MSPNALVKPCTTNREKTHTATEFASLALAIYSYIPRGVRSLPTRVLYQPVTDFQRRYLNRMLVGDTGAGIAQSV